MNIVDKHNLEEAMKYKSDEITRLKKENEELKARVEELEFMRKADKVVGGVDKKIIVSNNNGSAPSIKE